MAKKTSGSATGTAPTVAVAEAPAIAPPTVSGPGPVPAPAAAPAEPPKHDGEATIEKGPKKTRKKREKGDGPSKAEMIREALTAIGLDQKGKAVRQWVLNKHGIDLGSNIGSQIEAAKEKLLKQGVAVIKEKKESASVPQVRQVIAAAKLLLSLGENEAHAVLNDLSSNKYTDSY